MTGKPNALLRAEFPLHLQRDHATLAAGDPATTTAPRTAAAPKMGIRDIDSEPWAHSALTRAAARNRPGPAVGAGNAAAPRFSNTGCIHPRLERRPNREDGA